MNRNSFVSFLFKGYLLAFIILWLTNHTLTTFTLDILALESTLTSSSSTSTIVKRTGKEKSTEAK